jgi:hypothetical protein
MRWLQLLSVFLPNWRFFHDTRPSPRLEIRAANGHFEVLPRPPIGLCDNGPHHLWLLTQGLAQDLQDPHSLQLLAHSLRGQEWRVTWQGEVICQSS